MAPGLIYTSDFWNARCIGHNGHLGQTAGSVGDPDAPQLIIDNRAVALDYGDSKRQSRGHRDGSDRGSHHDSANQAKGDWLCDKVIERTTNTNAVLFPTTWCIERMHHRFWMAVVWMPKFRAKDGMLPMFICSTVRCDHCPTWATARA